MKRSLSGLILAFALSAPVVADDLADRFATPPPSARPWVYWFPLSGNLTKEGITADLEAMARVGIGGVLYMETDQGAPAGPADFAGPLWMDLISHACREADRLGLQINMNNDAGWCGSGGPWITPELSMQKVVWSETVVEQPAAANQASPVTLPKPANIVHGYYEDIAVLAVPAPAVESRLPDIEGKASFKTQHLPPLPATFPQTPPDSTIPRNKVVDVTKQMSKEGRLDWTPPEPGKWLVLRFGHTTTGKDNHPAPAPGRGLECDKFSKEAAAVHFRNLMGRLIEKNKSFTGPNKPLISTHIDSWEVGSQNWTPKMREEFRTRHGYDIIPFLPAFTGRILEDTETTERFLWDLRQTVNDLLLDNYASAFHELANQNGIRLSIEAYDNEPADDLAYAGRCDEPMGEFWSWGKFGADYSCTEMTSAAHTYGKPVIGAEAFTATDAEKWQGHPAIIKDLGDWAFCEGINRFVFHRYAAQPWLDRAPGMSMGPWGLHYERTQTWWEMSKAWHEYLGRCQYLLQQGKFVADIAYLAPEGTPRRWGPPAEANIAPHIRGGYNFDLCAPEVVLTRMQVKDDRLVLPHGMSYAALVLPPVETMTLPLLKKIDQLARQGALVVGPAKPPVKSPSLAERGASDNEVLRIARELWSSGKVLAGKTAQSLLAERGLPPDFTSTPMLRHIHRRLDDADVYFVANPQTTDIQAAATFRITGKQPELWWPDSGRREDCATFSVSKDTTKLAFHLEPRGSAFVVFRKPLSVSQPIIALKPTSGPGWSLDAKPPQPRVLKATYGVPGDAQRTRDLTAKVQQRIDAGERELPVASLAQGDDPAFGVVKTLRIEYAIEGKTSIVTGKDTESVHLADASTKITVTNATYGVPGDPQRTRDVKALVQKMADRGERSFLVSVLAAKDDPAYGIVKTLDIDYTQDGNPLHLTGTDTEVVSFETGGNPLPLGEILAQGQSTILRAWQPGRFECRTADGKSKVTEVRDFPQAPVVNGPWKVRFDPAAGGPGEVEFPALADWSTRPEDGIRFYSGTAGYRTTFPFSPPEHHQSTDWFLDLDRVEVMASVKLNGQDLGILWKPPYRIDVTKFLRPGTNDLEVSVVNLWINRQIGDESLPEDCDRNPNGTLRAWPQWVQENKPSPSRRFTFTSWKLWKKTDPLHPSGLLGPVKLLPALRVAVE